MIKSAFVFGALLTVAALPAIAQTTQSGTQTGSGAPAGAGQGGNTGGTMARTGTRWPHQSGFWGYAGVAGGVSRYDTCSGGLSCDERDTAWKFFVGGRFNQNFALEVGYNNFGTGELGGGSVKAHGINVSVLAGVPIGANSNIYGKFGTTYGETRVSVGAPGFGPGKERDWATSYGAGINMGLGATNWQARLDWDRNRFKFAGGKENVDSLTIGLQYKF
jgi:OOP family OmpA-OmpF porin